MTRLLFPCLLFSSLLLSACVNRAPATQPLTQTQLNTSLSNSEMRLTENLSQLCQTLETRQGFQSGQLQDIERNQRQMNSKLEQIEEQLQQKAASTTPKAAAAAKPAQCPAVAPAARTNGNINNLGDKMVLGRREWMWIETINSVFEARVDTGATTSSISAQDIVDFEKDGKRWVRFLLVPNGAESRFEVEAPLVRYVRILQSSQEGGEYDRRPVVSMTVKVGNMIEETEFTLTDRSHMTYPILLGRSFLKDIAVVDVAKDYIQPKPAIIGTPKQALPTSDADKK
jgi:hypothetical protein